MCARAPTEPETEGDEDGNMSRDPSLDMLRNEACHAKKKMVKTNRTRKKTTKGP